MAQINYLLDKIKKYTKISWDSSFVACENSSILRTCELKNNLKKYNEHSCGCFVSHTFHAEESRLCAGNFDLTLYNRVRFK